MNANSGYVGWSMSRNAAQAYADGEMPKSKWTRAAMLQAIQDYCWVEGYRYPRDLLASMKKDEIFARFFYQSSWHHTSKFFNSTNFYSIDDAELCEVLEVLPVWEQSAMTCCFDACLAENDLRYEDTRRMRIAERAEYIEAHGYEPESIAAFAELFPEYVDSRKSRRGYSMYALNNLGLETFPGLEWNDFRSARNRLYGFSAVGIGFDDPSGLFSDRVFRCPTQQEGRSMPDSPQDLDLSHGPKPAAISEAARRGASSSVIGSANCTVSEVHHGVAR